VVRYVHLPGSAVDTALLEDGMFFYSWWKGMLTVCNSDTERSCAAGNEGEVMGQNWVYGQAMGT
jgi:hypothetical protein